MQPIYLPQKRPVSADTDELSSSKKRRTDLVESDPLNCLIPEIVHQILRHLPWNEVLKFVGVSKKVPVPETYWFDLLEEEKLNFVWVKETESLKERYFLGKALYRYIETPKQNIQAEKIFEQFQKTMKQSPVFAAFVTRNLKPNQKLTARHEISLDTITNPTTAAGFLLKGLLKVSELAKKEPNSFSYLIKSQELYHILKTAIAQNVPRTSYLTSKTAHPFLVNQVGLQSLLFKLSKKESNKKDFKGMEYLLEQENLQHIVLKSLGSTEPPFLAALGSRSGNLIEKALFFDKAVQDYGDQVPVTVLNNAGWAKLILGSWKEAADYYDRAIVLGADDLSRATDFINAAFAKLNFGLWKEASDSYRRAIIAYESKTQGKKVVNGEWAKLQLELWQDTAHFCGFAILNYGDQVPSWVSAISTSAKLQLELWKEAANSSNCTMEKFAEQFPEWVLANAAWAEIHQSSQLF